MFLLIIVCVLCTLKLKSKVLLNVGKISRLMVSNETVKVKISQISAPISITYADEFTKYFPNIALPLSAQSS